MPQNWLISRLGFISHILAALIPLAWQFGRSGQPPAVELILFCALFGLLPDIDTGASVIGRLLPFISAPIESRFGHRTITHSMAAVIIIGLITWLAYGDDWVWLTAAYASHLLIDMIIGSGIPLAWPHSQLFYVVQVKSGTIAEGVLVGALAIGLAVPLLNPASAVQVASIATIPTPRPTLTPTPMIFTVKIGNVYDIEREILIATGDRIERGQMLASLDTWRRLNLEPETAVSSPSPTATATASPTPPLPTPHAPHPTPDQLYLAELENRRDLARARYRAIVATGTPDPNKLAEVPTYNLAITEKRDCLNANEAGSWRHELCLKALHELEATAQALQVTAVPVDPLVVDIARLELQAAEIAYAQAIAALTPRPTAVSSPSPTATATASPTPPLPTPHAPHPTPTLPAADPFTVYSQLSGEVAAVNLVSVEGNSVTIQITVLVDAADPLFANPFQERTSEATTAVNGEVPGSARAATVQHVADGDTLDVVLDGVTETVRLLGVNTPETVKPNSPVECFGPEASAFTKSVLGEGTAVYVELDPQTDERDRFGRLLAHVWLGDGTLFNEALLAEGFAVFNDYGTASIYQSRYEGAAAAAEAAAAGLWGVCQ